MNPTGFSNPQAIAESKLLDYFRENGVFTHPEYSDIRVSKLFVGGGVQQSINFENMLLAVVRMYRSEGRGDPRHMQRMLIKCLEDNIL